ncbi:hypothetical protein GSI_10738 [Ganoderma sinense ZZ0214-1]|uniref:C2H2-type domain-containing protein n=1 Tax=Ganoderma sinense ZZ0214-1 TaxID=1077348 RepID=A0A2G8S1H9_9APHY|nr:hypothetical protein GSI_10738 [Ganoderma sinense ZZ0214-1]
MAAYSPSEAIPLSSSYVHPSSDEVDPPPDTTYSNIPYYQSCWHQAETLPSTQGLWYNADDLNGGNYCFDSSYEIAIGNSQVSPYEAAYTAGGLWNAGPTLSPNPMAAVPTVAYPSSASFPVPANGTYHDTPPYTTSGMSFPSPQRPPQVQELSDSRASHHSHALRCLWGTPACGQRLSDGSSATVRAHLREAHGIGHGTSAPDARRATARCLWGGECSLNSEHILVSGMGKHVATCHLKTTSLSCPSCGRVCSRQDALRRHADLYCRAARQAGDHGDGRVEPTGRRS